MKKEYETPSLKIDWFETDDTLAYGNSSYDYIPDTEYDDAFGDL